ncbi:zinc metalloprotease HtpX [Methanobacterium sp. ACI-7]|uniref:zinc metalloprotease HtpX n=1 Tax=unclassified Methanobacterium TaxID=2627676 RepID=UPI0039C2C663
MFSSAWSLRIRIWITMVLLFGLLYALMTVIGYYSGYGGPLIYAGLAIGIVFLQFMIGPKIVEWTMKVKYVSPEEAPELHRMVEELAEKANIPKPKVGVSKVNIPNAFAFGRSKKGGKLAVTQGILDILNKDELRAVIGHEISHIRHRDMIVITVLSIVPLIFYYIFISTFYGGMSGRDRSGAALIGIAALVAYFIGNLLILFVSRTREYYADEGSIELGNSPNQLASALYKLVYGSAKVRKEDLKQIEGLKAFFVNDVSSAGNEITDLQSIDIDKDYSISESELQELKYRETKVNTADKLLEVFSTHPNMVKRVKRLADLSE